MDSYVNMLIMMSDTVLTVVLNWSECSSVCSGSVYTVCVGARERIMSDRYGVREEKREVQPSLYIPNCLTLPASKRAVHGV